MVLYFNRYLCQYSVHILAADKNLAFGNLPFTAVLYSLGVDNLINSLFVHVPNFGEVSGSEERGGGDNSIQFINIGRVGDKVLKNGDKK